MAYIDIQTQDQFNSDVLKSSLPVVVDFWAEWCGPCKIIEPVFTELSDQYKDKMIFARLNVDSLPSIASGYGVLSIPTMIVFKDGKDASRTIGAHPKMDYVNIFNQLV